MAVLPFCVFSLQALLSVEININMYQVDQRRWTGHGNVTIMEPRSLNTAHLRGRDEPHLLRPLEREAHFLHACVSLRVHACVLVSVCVLLNTAL